MVTIEKYPIHSRNMMKIFAARMITMNDKMHPLNARLFKFGVVGGMNQNIVRALTNPRYLSI